MHMCKDRPTKNAFLARNDIYIVDDIFIVFLSLSLSLSCGFTENDLSIRQDRRESGGGGEGVQLAGRGQHRARMAQHRLAALVPDPDIRGAKILRNGKCR